MPIIEGIMEAEILCEKLQMNEVWVSGNMESVFQCTGEKQLSSIVKWAKKIPHFTELAIHDQVLFMIYGFIVKPRPKTQTPKAQPQPSQIQSKSVPKGLGLTLKS